MVEIRPDLIHDFETPVERDSGVRTKSALKISRSVEALNNKPVQMATIEQRITGEDESKSMEVSHSDLKVVEHPKQVYPVFRNELEKNLESLRSRRELPHKEKSIQKSMNLNDMEDVVFDKQIAIGKNLSKSNTEDFKYEKRKISMESDIDKSESAYRTPVPPSRGTRDDLANIVTQGLPNSNSQKLNLPKTPRRSISKDSPSQHGSKDDLSEKKSYVARVPKREDSKKSLDLKKHQESLVNQIYKREGSRPENHDTINSTEFREGGKPLVPLSSKDLKNIPGVDPGKFLPRSKTAPKNIEEKPSGIPGCRYCECPSYARSPFNPDKCANCFHMH